MYPSLKKKILNSWVKRTQIRISNFLPSKRSGFSRYFWIIKELTLNLGTDVTSRILKDFFTSEEDSTMELFVILICYLGLEYYMYIFIKSYKVCISLKMWIPFPWIWNDVLGCDMRALRSTNTANSLKRSFPSVPALSKNMKLSGQESCSVSFSAVSANVFCSETWEVQVSWVSRISGSDFDDCRSWGRKGSGRR